jgi:hypothetical protein
MKDSMYCLVGAALCLFGCIGVLFLYVTGFKDEGLE